MIITYHFNTYEICCVTKFIVINKHYTINKHIYIYIYNENGYVLYVSSVGKLLCNYHELKWLKKGKKIVLLNLCFYYLEIIIIFVFIDFLLLIYGPFGSPF